MSCFLRTDLAPTLPPGGYWTYEGYEVAEPFVDWDETPANPPFLLVVGAEIPGGDDPEVVDDSVTVGFYRFVYHIGAQEHPRILRVVSGTECAGVSGTLTVDPASATPVNLFNLLDGPGCLTVTTGGTWEDVDGAGAAFVAPNLTPNLLPDTGTYRFAYTIEDSDFPEARCSDCPARTATISVVAQAALDVTISEADDTCAYTIYAQNPDDATQDEFKITLVENDNYPSVEAQVVVEDCNSNVVLDEVRNYRGSHRVYNTVINTANPLQNGGYFKTMTLSSTTGGVQSITVPLAPTTATMSGPGGAVNATDLVYNGVNGSVVAAAIQKCIINYLDTLGKTSGTHYGIRTVAAGSILGTIVISFYCKHDPDTEWIGLNRYTGTPDEITITVDGSGDVTTGVNQTGAHGVVPNVIYQPFPCPSLRIRYESMLIIDLSTSDYNIIVLNGATYAATEIPADTTRSASCPTVVLTANTVNCSGSPSYLWNTGATTQAIEVSTSGTYSVTVTCSNGSEEESIFVAL